MKKSDFKELPFCLNCGCEATEIHELIFGQGIREMAIEYNIQCCLCRMHHNHGHMYPDWNIRMFRILGLCYVSIRKLSRKNFDKWTEKDKEFMRNEGNKVLKFYKEYLK